MPVRDVVVERMELLACERTDLALVRPFVRVCPNMLVYMLFSSSGIRADITRVWPIICMRFFVIDYHT